MDATATALANELVAQTRYYLQSDLEKIRAACARLDEAELWSRPNEHTLAPANQLIHLAGNLRQWVLAHVGGDPDVRTRDAEFAARHGRAKAEVLAELEGVVAQVSGVLDGLSPEDLLRPATVQGHATTVTGILVHVTEHFSYHTGQLLFYVKQLHPEPFDFYAGWDLGGVGG